MFVTFEGPEGAGKSTLIARLADSFRQQGRGVLVTREPGAGDVGQKIRQLLLDGADLDFRAELFLFLADRAQHVAHIIRPALSAGQIVLCDRYADSTVVYQGYARGLDIEALRTWNTFATDGLKPKLTLLLDLDPSVGLARIQSKDRLDAQPLEFHTKVREGFLSEASRDPQRWHVIDASASPDEVFAQALTTLTNRIKSFP